MTTVPYARGAYTTTSWESLALRFSRAIYRTVSYRIDRRGARVERAHYRAAVSEGQRRRAAAFLIGLAQR